MIVERKYKYGGEDKAIDEVLDAALGFCSAPPQKHPSQGAPSTMSPEHNSSSSEQAMENIRQKQNRLAMLRERIKLRKERSNDIQSLVGKNDETPSASTHTTLIVSTLEHDEQRKDPERSVSATGLEKYQTPNEQIPGAITSLETIKVDMAFQQQLADDSPSRKRLELKEKLRQKEAQLALLRSKTLLRKRPLEDRPEESKASSRRMAGTSTATTTTSFAEEQPDASTTTSITTPTSALDDHDVVNEQLWADERQKRADHIKRVKMMTAQKREQLARYKNTFARQAAAEAY
ncbi:hypothetical protein ACA910_012121 [Epithemia clementina (nom. ined.)]